MGVTSVLALSCPEAESIRILVELLVEWGLGSFVLVFGTFPIEILNGDLLTGGTFLALYLKGQ